MKDSFEKILHSKLANHQVTPPDYILSELQKQYPKKSFFDLLKNPKSLTIFISSIIIIGLVSVHFINQSNNKTATYLPNKIENTSNTKQEIINQDISPNSKIPKDEIAQINRPPVRNNENTNEIKLVNIFKNKDTIVCGNTFVLNSDIDINTLFVNDDLNISKNNSGETVICCTKDGSYKLYYKNTENNITYFDSLSIDFIITNTPEIEISRAINCPNEPLLIKLKTNCDNNIDWNVPHAQINKLDNGYYKILWDNYNNDSALISININEKGCLHTIEKSVFLPSTPKVKITKSPEICNNKNATIIINTDESNINSFNIHNKYSGSGKFDSLKAGSYNLNILYNNSCTYTIPIEINSEGIINAGFEFEFDDFDEQKINLINTTTIDGNSYTDFDNISFIWQIGNKYAYDANPTFIVDRNLDENIKLTVNYGNDCSETLEKPITSNEDFIKAPNIFSPNGDGISDVFKIKIGTTISFEAIITNTRGEVIYRWTNPDEGWDGMISGGNHASEGVYYYIIKATKPKGSIVEKKGILQLIRN
ncbi:MAG TPA: gliding motility-associated C-terminal domain-containing protein [Bacteroidales bacterium]|nr:gliding motility-associated C-terminal domain-containing protein [Bacteroidales bacterium]